MTRRVLVVDDDELTREVLATILDLEEFDVDVAADGERALPAIAADPPDVVVLDVMMPGIGDAVRIIRSHHERWDGGGYPEGLAGEDVYLPARIFSIIDTFDAMTSNRPYRKALPVDVALEEIERHGGTQFDPFLAGEFVAMCDEMGIAELGAENLTIVR